MFCSLFEFWSLCLILKIVLFSHFTNKIVNTGKQKKLLINIIHPHFLSHQPTVPVVLGFGLLKWMEFPVGISLNYLGISSCFHGLVPKAVTSTIVPFYPGLPLINWTENHRQYWPTSWPKVNLRCGVHQLLTKRASSGLESLQYKAFVNVLLKRGLNQCRYKNIRFCCANCTYKMNGDCRILQNRR